MTCIAIKFVDDDDDILGAQQSRSNNHIAFFSSACYKCVELTATNYKFLTVGDV